MAESSPPPPPSDEDRLAISRRLLLSSPPGQFDLILADLRNIQKSTSVADGLLSDDWAEGVRSEYEQITRRDCLDASSGGEEGETDLEKALREAIGKYMSDHYVGSTIGKEKVGGEPKEGTSNRSNFAVKSDRGDDGKITIRTYAENVDLRNYRAGSWSAEYRISPSGEGGSGGSSSEVEIEGTVDVVAHAFENGNVQMRSSIPLGPSAVGADSKSPQDVARAVVDQIQRWEDDDVQGKLGTMYDSVNDTMLKSLRRVMPVTRTRMDWNLATHRLAKTMASRKAQEHE